MKLLLFYLGYHFRLTHFDTTRMPQIHFKIKIEFRSRLLNLRLKTSSAINRTISTQMCIYLNMHIDMARGGSRGDLAVEHTHLSKSAHTCATHQRICTRLAPEHVLGYILTLFPHSTRTYLFARTLWNTEQSQCFQISSPIDRASMYP